MIDRALNEIDRHIAETREHIKREREFLVRLRESAHAADLSRSEDLLKTLENSLTVLLERRRTILGDTRRPRAAARPQRMEKPRRRRGA